MNMLYPLFNMHLKRNIPSGFIEAVCGKILAQDTIFADLGECFMMIRIHANKIITHEKRSKPGTGWGYAVKASVNEAAGALAFLCMVMFVGIYPDNERDLFWEQKTNFCVGRPRTVNKV